MVRRSIVRFGATAALLVLNARASADFRAFGFDALKVIDARAKRPDGLSADRLSNAAGEPRGPAAAWAAGVELSALNAAARLDPAWIKRANDYAVALDKYRGMSAAGVVAYQPFPGANGGDLYYDDNEWLILAFLDTYALTHNREHLRRAVDAYRFALSGESNVLGGGIFWRADKLESKNTCSNAPAACAALELYRVTKETKYLDDGKRLRDWTTTTLQDADGLFFDAINLDKSIGRTKWSYNAALMIRANGLLFEITGEKRYLDEAIRIGDASEAKWFRTTDGALDDEASFAHLLAENLLYLDRLAPREGRRAKVEAALVRLRSFVRQGAYPQRWDGWQPKETSTELLTQASAARGFLMAAGVEAPTTRPAR